MEETNIPKCVPKYLQSQSIFNRFWKKLISNTLGVAKKEVL